MKMMAVRATTLRRARSMLWRWPAALALPVALLSTTSSPRRSPKSDLEPPPAEPRAADGEQTASYDADAVVRNVDRRMEPLINEVSAQGAVRH